ncbi:DUF3618 domain-containing protein [Microlunatus elymi]|uniref:DUF3618 domain-containing protein n=1 Tax=Microlunatus elymi TaxID=2596828 RepID=UPI001D188BC8|nr:DUF3618 domain-containing protein [Microlunatus elymi]
MADATSPGSAGSGSAPARSAHPRTKAQIEADLAATRQRLANSIEDLIDQVHPQRVKQRQIESAKSFAKAELDYVKAQLYYPSGELRTSRLAAVGGAVAGFVTFVLVMRRIVRGGKRRQS